MGRRDEQKKPKGAKSTKIRAQNSECCNNAGERKYQLVKYHNLPDYLRDNEYIKDYYRANWPLKQAFFSIFTLHNETLNVWTHLIGFFLFVWLTIYTAMKLPQVVDSRCFQHISDVFKRADLHKFQADIRTCLPSFPNMSDLQKMVSDCLPYRLLSGNHSDPSILRTMTDDVVNTITPLVRQPITRWPFFAFLGGAMVCLFCSSTCHLLCCHSERLASIMLRVDYIGIVALITTSSYPLVYYSFIYHPFFRNLYIGFITFLGVVIIVFSLFPAFQKPEYRYLRAVMFSGMGMSGLLPILHKQILYWDQPEAMYTTGLEMLMSLFYGLGVLLYATRVPERWMPGKFDIVGHSHQLFHVLVVAGVYTHYRSGLVYLKWRDSEGC